MFGFLYGRALIDSNHPISKAELIRFFLLNERFTWLTRCRRCRRRRSRQTWPRPTTASSRGSST